MKTTNNNNMETTTTNTEKTNNYCADAYKKATTKHAHKYGYQNTTFAEFIEIVKNDILNKYYQIQFYENGKFIGYSENGVINNVK